MCIIVVGLLGLVLFSSGTRRAPTMDWWQGSRAATSSQCWIGSGNFTVVATARDAHIPAGEFSSQTQLLTASGDGGELAGWWGAVLWSRLLASNKPGLSQTSFNYSI